MYDNSNINAIILHLCTIMPQLYDVQFNFLVDGIVMLIYSWDTTNSSYKSN